MVTGLESWNDWKDAYFPLCNQIKETNIEFHVLELDSFFQVTCEGIHNNHDNGNLSEPIYTDVFSVIRDKFSYSPIIHKESKETKHIHI